MPEWIGLPQPARLARPCSIQIAASWPKSPPAPPYSAGIEGHRRPSSPAWGQVSRSMIPALRQRSKCGRHSSSMNFAVMSESIRCSSVIHADMGRLLLTLAGVQFGIEQAQAMREAVIVDHAVEILEQEGERLALVEPGLLREAAQAAVSILGHRGVEPARQAEAFRHDRSFPSRAGPGPSLDRAGAGFHRRRGGHGYSAACPGAEGVAAGTARIAAIMSAPWRICACNSAMAAVSASRCCSISASRVSAICWAR